MPSTKNPVVPLSCCDTAAVEAIIFNQISNGEYDDNDQLNTPGLSLCITDSWDKYESGNQTSNFYRLVSIIIVQ